MEKEVVKEFFKNLNDAIVGVVEKFLKTPKNKEIQLISHFDTDGITSAAIIIKCLKRLDRKFNTLIVKNLSPEIILQIPRIGLFYSQILPQILSNT